MNAPIDMTSLAYLREASERDVAYYRKQAADAEERAVRARERAARRDGQLWLLVALDVVLATAGLCWWGLS